MKQLVQSLIARQPVPPSAAAAMVKEGVARAMYRVQSSEATFYTREFKEDGTTTAYPQDPSCVKFDKPTIICVGGIEAVERKDISPPGGDYTEYVRNYSEIGGVMKIIYTALGGDNIRYNPNAPQIFSLSTTHLTSNKWNLSLSNRFPDSWAGADAIKLAEATLPLLSDDYEIRRNGKVAGVRLDVDEAVTRLSNITLYGHSYGNSLFRQYSVAKRRHMAQLGYTQEEIVMLCNAIVSIATGPVMDTISKGRDPFNSVYLISPDDTSAQKRVTDFDDLVPRRLAKGEYQVQYPDPNTAVLWLPPIEKPYYYINCNGEMEATNDAHNMRAYTAFSLADPVRAAYFETVLMNAVQRTGLVTPEGLLAPNPERFAKNVEREDASPTFPILPTRESTRAYTENIIKAIIRQARERRVEGKMMPYMSQLSHAERILEEKEQQQQSKGTGIGE